MLSKEKQSTPAVGGSQVIAFSPVGIANFFPSSVTLLAGIIPFFWNASIAKFWARTRSYLHNK
jgi:hypothetical protein